VQTKTPINTNPLVKFIQDIKQANNSRQKEIRLPIDQANTIALTLGQVMSRLEGDLELLVAAYAEKSNNDQEIVINLDGGSNF